MSKYALIKCQKCGEWFSASAYSKAVICKDCKKKSKSEVEK